MRASAIFILIGAFALGCYGLVTNPTVLKNMASVVAATDTSLQACLEAINTEQSSTISVYDVSIDRVEIDNNTSSDYILKLNTETYCGTTGCVHEICLNQETAATKIAFGYAANTVTVTETITNDMHDLLLDSGASLAWDGERYLPIE